MSISLIGLVSFQIYWIKNAISIEREKFNRSAFEAMEKVVSKIEKAETVFYLADRTSQIFHHDTVPGILYQEEEQVVKKFRYSDSMLSNKTKIFRFNTPFAASAGFSAAVPFEFNDTLIKHFNPEIFEHPLPPPPPSLDSIHKTIRRNIEKVNNKEAIIKEVMKDVLRPHIDLKSRISKELLNKYLEEELKNKGLGLKYDFAVQAGNQNKFLFTSIDKETSLKLSEFKVKLFPNDIFAGNDFLVVHFPDKYEFIIKKTWITLLASVLLIAVIIYCFAFTVITLVKQKKLSEMKNDFINNMTHEFKTPIATVALTCEALEDPDLKKDERLLQRYVSVIKDENKRLGKQVEKVLQIASLDKKDFKLNLKEQDLHQITRKAIDNIKIQIINRDGNISENLKATKTSLLADDLHLTNIIYNLLDNANKYSPEKPEIDILTEDTPEGVLIKVKDNGSGIAKDQQTKIFEKFYRVPTGNVHDVKGFGLGLAYVKSMVEAHGGRITVQSILGKGTEFQVFLPSQKSD